MDKYANILKLEEIKRLSGLKKYDKAFKIVETLDVNRIRSMSDLTMIAEVYEKNGLLDEAIHILLRIYDRSSSRRIIYQLARLNIRKKNLEEAEKFYDEFILAAPKDYNRFILRYYLDRAKGESYDTLIKTLEELKRNDYIEDWAYELAKLYHKAGYKEKCLNECSEIVLMFGEGLVVEKAKYLREHYLNAREEKQKKPEEVPVEVKVDEPEEVNAAELGEVKIVEIEVEVENEEQEELEKADEAEVEKPEEVQIVQGKDFDTNESGDIRKDESEEYETDGSGDLRKDESEEYESDGSRESGKGESEEYETDGLGDLRKDESEEYELDGSRESRKDESEEYEIDGLGDLRKDESEEYEIDGLGDLRKDESEEYELDGSRESRKDESEEYETDGLGDLRKDESEGYEADGSGELRKNESEEFQTDGSGELRKDQLEEYEQDGSGEEESEGNTAQEETSQEDEYMESIELSLRQSVLSFEEDLSEEKQQEEQSLYNNYENEKTNISDAEDPFPKEYDSDKTDTPESITDIDTFEESRSYNPTDESILNENDTEESPIVQENEEPQVESTLYEENNEETLEHLETVVLPEYLPLDHQFIFEAFNMPSNETIEITINNTNLNSIFDNYAEITSLAVQLPRLFEDMVQNPSNRNLVLAGVPFSGKTTLAKMIAKALYKLNILSSPKIAKISAEKLNQVNLKDKYNQLSGCCIIVEQAAELTKQTVSNIIEMTRNIGESIVIILEDRAETLDLLFYDNAILTTAFSNTILMPAYNFNDLNGFAYQYFKEQGLTLQQDAVVVLDDMIHQVMEQMSEEYYLLTVIDIVQCAAEACRKRDKERLKTIVQSGSYSEVELSAVTVDDLLSQSMQ